MSIVKSQEVRKNKARGRMINLFRGVGITIVQSQGVRMPIVQSQGVKNVYCPK